MYDRNKTYFAILCEGAAILLKVTFLGFDNSRDFKSGTSKREKEKI
jgi:hypothetical protein